MKANFYISGKCMNLISFVAYHLNCMKLFLVSLFTVFCGLVFAQQNHFVYIQSDNQQAFYVKLDKKIMSSSGSGYLIIPKLREGSYEFSIGFPKEEWPEQKISCYVTSSDAGYLLKNFGDKGWGLFNFQTMDLLMAGNVKPEDSLAAKANSEDAFASVLSKAVNDPSISNKEQEVKPLVPDTIQLVSKRVLKPVKKKGEQALVKNKAGKPAPVKRNRVVKLEEQIASDSASLKYVDLGKGKPDTISVIIPPLPAAEEMVMTKPQQDSTPVIAVVKPDPVMPAADSVVAIPVSRPVEDEAASTIIKNKTTIPEPSSDSLKANRDTGSVVLEIPVQPKDSLSQGVVESAVPAQKDTLHVLVAVMNPILADSSLSGQVVVKTDSIDASTILKNVKADEVPVSQDSSGMARVDAEPVKVPVSADSLISPPMVDTAVSVMARLDSVEVPVVTEDNQGNKRSGKKGLGLFKKRKQEKVKEEPVTEVKPVVVQDTAMAKVSEIRPELVDTAVVAVKQPAEPELKKQPEKVADPVEVKVNKPVVQETVSVQTAMSRPLLKCTFYADDDEFLNLRKKMDKGRDNENQMLNMAHKAFEKRCFNVRQIQRLSILFQTDESKYKFFDDAYNYTYDPENFPSLIVELNDDYYKRRFKAMLR